MKQDHGEGAPGGGGTGALTKAFVMVVLASAMTASSAAEPATASGSRSNRFAAVLTAAKATVRLGDPIKVTVSVTNQGDRETSIDKSMMMFDCFEVTAPGGQSAPYVGFVGQVMAEQVAVGPSATVVVAEALDLTDKYLFQRPGRYSIRLRGTPFPGMSPSEGITVEVMPGQLSELDQMVIQLLLICPAGWSIERSGRGQEETAPFGRTRVPGYTAHIYRSFMRGDAVYVWLTKTPAPLAPNPQTSESEYLGRVRGFHVYAALAVKPLRVWPKALEDIAGALRTTND